MKHLILTICLLSGVSYGLQADINNDGRVDVGDLAIMAREWLMQEQILVIDGIGLMPDIVGWQFESELYNNALSYQGELYCVWWNKNSNQWVISAGKGTITGKIWVNNKDFPTGCYFPMGGASGVPIVNEELK